MLSALIPFTEKGEGKLIWLSYYILTSVFLKGATVGKRLMRIRVGGARGTQGTEPHWYQYVIRYCCLWAALYLFPALILIVVCPDR